MRRRLATLVVLGSAAALALGNVGYAASTARASSPRPSVVLDSCTGVVATSTQVTWANFKTGSVVLEYRKSTPAAPSTQRHRGSSTKVLSAATNTAVVGRSGSVVVATPNAALSGTWYVYSAKLYSYANARGTATTVVLNCGATPPGTTTTTTSSTTTTTTIPCTTAPTNSVAPSIYSTGSAVTTSSEGTWDAGPNCSFTSTSYGWERSYNYGAWEAFGGPTDPWEPQGCALRYRLTLTKYNEFGSASATSNEIGPFC